MKEKTYIPYYLGIDAGSGSVGWAVTDTMYHVLKCKGKAMWGVRLFPDASTAAERRTCRAARRRLQRRKQRLDILEMLFAPALNEKDPQFLARMHESDLWQDDKSVMSKYSLFADSDFTDCDYHRKDKYPTAYHLRSELAHSAEPHDVRLVYLALHHLMKSRGHFLYEMSETSANDSSLKNKFDDFCRLLSDVYGLEFATDKRTDYLNILKTPNMRVTEKANLLTEGQKKPGKGETGLSLFYISELLAGKTVALSNLFGEDGLKNIKKIALKNDLEADYDELCEALGDHISVINAAKDVYDAARFAEIIGTHRFLCDAKVDVYKQNGIDLRILKDYVKEHCADRYKTVFCDKKKKLDNYAAYSKYHHNSGDYVCSQEEFCKFLKKTLPEMAESENLAIATIYQKIIDGSFLPRLRSCENGLIPYQLQLRELEAILENASSYLPFLVQRQDDGYTPAEKIKSTFEFRVPYYVGPINDKAAHHWAVRTDSREKVYPWNFNRLVDLDRSAEAFLVNLIGRCTYTGEPVLPKDSLLYSEYMLLNELNPLQIDGHPLPIECKKQLIEDLFVHPTSGQKGKVTKKKIYGYLKSKGWLPNTADIDSITGIDDKIKSDLRSHRDFADILTRTGDCQLVEDIIRHVLVFGEDKKMLRRWLRTHKDVLTEENIQKICRLRYSDWGRLSKTFLTDICTAGEYGEAKSIMDMLRETNDNLMQLLSDKYEFAAHAEAYRNEKFGNNQSLTDRLDEMYISPAVRRSIRQTLRIVDEIVKLRGIPPTKIFIEMARDSRNDMKGKRTESRKEKLLALYKECQKDSRSFAQMCISEQEIEELHQKLAAEDENHLRSERLYLYYTQFGRCMYSGEPMDLSAVMHGERYDRDHIFPRSKIKDDSLSNLVLVKNELNREKKNTYPIDYSIRQKMLPFWKLLKDRGMISEKKYERLRRSAELTEEELSDFVARQLVQTQQSTKALSVLLKERYGDQTRIVFSKAGNVSEFRQEFGIVKCREVNDLHHAKDAYLNIVVGNVYDTRFTSKFFKNIQNEDYSIKTETLFKKLSTPGAWDKVETIKTVQSYMTKNNILVTRMPHEQKGAISDLQLLPAGKGQLRKKQQLDIRKYGGYNKRTVSYFFAVEYLDKKKRVRAIHPVFLTQKALYEKDPIKYCTMQLSLDQPRIIRKKILIDSLIELDGKRLYPSARTGNNIIYEHSYQLTANNAQLQYIKNIAKYVERCNAAKKELNITPFDGISIEQNIQCYDWLIDKCYQPVYVEFVKNMQTYLRDNRERFSGLSLLNQSKLLLEILKAFQCGPQNPNLDMLCGVKTVARISKSSNLSNYDSVFLVDQSITGLYERKINLLK